MVGNQCKLLKFSTFVVPTNSRRYNNKSITHYENYNQLLCLLRRS